MRDNYLTCIEDRFKVVLKFLVELFIYNLKYMIFFLGSYRFYLTSYTGSIPQNRIIYNSEYFVIINFIRICLINKLFICLLSLIFRGLV